MKPYKSPEGLFEPGPLRDAARAGWFAAMGRDATAERCRAVALEASRQDLDQAIARLLRGVREGQVRKVDLLELSGSSTHG